MFVCLLPCYTQEAAVKSCHAIAGETLRGDVLIEGCLSSSEINPTWRPDAGGNGDSGAERAAPLKKKKNLSNHLEIAIALWHNFGNIAFILNKRACEDLEWQWLCPYRQHMNAFCEMLTSKCDTQLNAKWMMLIGGRDNLCGIWLVGWRALPRAAWQCTWLACRMHSKYDTSWRQLAQLYLKKKKERFVGGVTCDHWWNSSPRARCFKDLQLDSTHTHDNNYHRQ